MSYLPQVNAELTEIVPASQSEDWDQPEQDAAASWSGSQEAYVVDNLRTVYDESAGAMRHVRDTRLYLAADWITQVGVKVGNFVIFSVGSQSYRRRVMELNVAAKPDAGPLASVPHNIMTLHLDPTPLEN